MDIKQYNLVVVVHSKTSSCSIAWNNTTRKIFEI